MGLLVAGLDGHRFESDVEELGLGGCAGGQFAIVPEVVGERDLVVGVHMADDAVFGCCIFRCLVGHCERRQNR